MNTTARPSMWKVAVVFVSVAAVIGLRGAEPDTRAGRIERGTLPARWAPDDPDCAHAAPFSVHEYNPTFLSDTLYPGRLYIRDAQAFAASVDRLVNFTATREVAHVLGAHIENRRTPYLDYPEGTTFQPEEHVLELGRAHILELQDALHRMGSHLERRAFRDFTIWPVVRRYGRALRCEGHLRSIESGVVVGASAVSSARVGRTCTRIPEAP